MSRGLEGEPGSVYGEAAAWSSGLAGCLRRQPCVPPVPCPAGGAWPRAAGAARSRCLSWWPCLRACAHRWALAAFQLGGEWPELYKHSCAWAARSSVAAPWLVPARWCSRAPAGRCALVPLPTDALALARLPVSQLRLLTGPHRATTPPPQMQTMSRMMALSGGAQGERGAGQGLPQHAPRGTPGLYGSAPPATNACGPCVRPP